MAATTDDQGDVDMDAKNDSSNVEIDEQLYSRQIYVLGHDTMQKIGQNNVLIIGMNGLGAEIAKNVILAGVKSVSILDKTKVSIRDLGSHFYLTEGDIGKERGAACLSKMQQLNRHVKVSCIEEELSHKLIESKEYQVVVMVGFPLTQQIEYDNLCHKNGIKFISTDACGVFGSVFIDFGENFEICDTNGEPRKQGIVQLITNENGRCNITVHEGNRHGLTTGDFVTFDEIEGTTELNGCDPIQIIEHGPFAFELDCDASKFSAYKGNGMFFEVKQSKIVSYDTLESLIENPPKAKIAESDLAKDRVLQHIFYRALNEYRTKKGCFPAATSMEGAQEVVEIATQLTDAWNKTNVKQNNDTNNNNKSNDNEKDKKEEEVKVEPLKVDEYRFASMARCAGAVINPMCAALGGIVAQETLKACSGKFTPINQLFYLDAFESLPSIPNIFKKEKEEEESKQKDGNVKEIDITIEFKSENSRYDDNINVFGKSLQKAMENSKVFLIGAGAIGCEMLKNWSLMGVGCGSNGIIYVTDMDSIEKSNLNRQFLFRDIDVGKMKSEIAGKSVKEMNKDINIIAQQNRVGSESEDIYNDEFWMGLDVIVTALDNIDARLYVDAQSIKYNKPMLESGTLGTKGNTQVIVPKLTESYGSTRDPPEKTYPICTLHNFPNLLEHSIAWARDQFDGCFTKIPQDCNDYLTDSKYLEELSKDTTAELETLKSLNASLNDEKPMNFKDCIEWARNKFEHDYTFKIAQLLHNFPKDSKTNDGQMFWNGPKRAPDVIEFDSNDILHMSYVAAGANLRAYIYNIKGATMDFDKVRELLKDIKVKEYKIRKAKIAANDEELEQLKQELKVEDYDEQVQKLRDSLPKPESLVGFKLNALEFEKDVDENHHIDFIVAASNLRARNYRIKEGSRNEIKRIAGNIIPAIATTTALVTGLISFEFYKLMSVNEKKTLNDFRNSFCNLALPFVTLSNPVSTPEAIVTKKGKEWKFTIWDKIEIFDNKDMTCQELMNYFESEWGMELNMLSFGTTILYAFYMTPKKQKQRKEAKLKKLAKAANNNSLPNGCKFVEFEVSVSYMDSSDSSNQNEEEEDPELPTVRLYL